MSTPSTTAPAPSVTPAPRAPFRHKTVAGLLAFFFGWAGAHWWYLGRRLPWLPITFSIIVLTVSLYQTAPLGSQLGYYLFLIPLSAGFIEAVVLCLRSDEKFDATYNRGHDRKSANGWSAAILAALFLFFGMAAFMGHVVMFSLAMNDGSLGF